MHPSTFKLHVLCEGGKHIFRHLLQPPVSQHYLISLLQIERVQQPLCGNSVHITKLQVCIIILH